VTTDADRANAWLVDWIDWLPASERDAFLASLTELFAAVRMDERRAVAAHVRGWATTLGMRQDTVMGHLADAIERGEHA